MNSGFTKLFSSIVTSSLWVEPDPLLRVWIAMLATCDASGEVQGSIPGFAHLCCISVKEMQECEHKLMAPDPHSRTKTSEGRRIERIDGGWKIINYSAYREKGQDKPGSRAAYMRTRRNMLHQTVTCNTEAEAEAEAEKEKHVQECSPVDGDIFSEMRKRLSAIYKRKPSDRMNYEEECLLANVVRREDPIGEMNEIEAYFMRCDRKYFPHSLSSLLEKWNVTLDASRRPPDRTPDEQKAIARADASWVPPIPKSMRYEDPN